MYYNKNKMLLFILTKKKLSDNSRSFPLTIA